MSVIYTFGWLLCDCIVFPPFTVQLWATRRNYPQRAARLQVSNCLCLAAAVADAHTSKHRGHFEMYIFSALLSVYPFVKSCETQWMLVEAVPGTYTRIKLLDDF